MRIHCLHVSIPMIVAAGQVGVDGAMDVKHEGRDGRNHAPREQTIGFAALDIFPNARLLAARSFDKSKVDTGGEFIAY
jgi:hypothetical protein